MYLATGTIVFDGIGHQIHHYLFERIRIAACPNGRIAVRDQENFVIL